MHARRLIAIWERVQQARKRHWFFRLVFGAMACAITAIAFYFGTIILCWIGEKSLGVVASYHAGNQILQWILSRLPPAGAVTYLPLCLGLVIVVSSLLGVAFVWGCAVWAANDLSGFIGDSVKLVGALIWLGFFVLVAAAVGKWAWKTLF